VYFNVTVQLRNIYHVPYPWKGYLTPYNKDHFRALCCENNALWKQTWSCTFWNMHL